MTGLEWLFKLPARSRVFPFLAFLVPLVVRAIPEVLMGRFAVGFDTLAYYVPNTLVWLRDGVGFWSFLAVAPFFYVLLMGLTSFGVPIVLSLKVLSPLLLGFLGVAVYFYAANTLSWSPKKSLLVVLFSTLYFVALRVSWDMLRSELALIFLFATLILLEKDGSPRRNAVLLALAMLSVVFAEQLVAVIMFAVVLVTVTHLWLSKKTRAAGMIVASAVPAALLFSAIVYANYATSSSFSVLTGFPGQSSAGWMALFGFASYSGLVVNTLGFLVFCYLPLMPLLLLGAKRFGKNLQLSAWVSWVLIALLLVMISPDASFSVLPYRWILFLTYPLAFFAADAFAGLKLKSYKVGVVLVLAALSLSFIFLPNSLAFPYFGLFPFYVPTSMLQNTVSLSDCQATVNALNWAKTSMNNDSRLLVHDAFYGWASLTLSRDLLLAYGYADPAAYAQGLVENGSKYQLYLIWWVNGSGWNGRPTVSSAFREVYASGKIAVYEYDPSTVTDASVSAGLVP
jgi:hypothetical protein